jgi:flagellum-specific ATP synthase
MIKILPHEKIDILSKYRDMVRDVDPILHVGKVERVVGLTIESVGPDVEYGELCRIRLEKGGYLHAEVVGFNRNRVVLMPVGDMKGVVPGADVIAAGTALMVPVGDVLLGRVISGVGEPMDGKGEIFAREKYPVTSLPINPLERAVIDRQLSVGVRAIDGLNTVGRGQRLGVFSGSGVGKSTMIGMIARNTEADVNVIALIGERGREVKDFVEKELGPEGLRNSVVVVATSNQPAMLRIRGAYLAHAVAEYFRDRGMHVNLLMDSITRFSMAQREVGLAAGEPAVMRGYPPSVFSLMAKLMERCGTIAAGGSITGFYAVLVEADDMNEPIADHARSILDGHIVLERRLAHKGHYPAVDILQSISRCMKDVVTPEHNAAAARFRELLAAYAEHEDEISLGAYAKGSVPEVDLAIEMMDRMNGFLRQGIYEKDGYDSIVQKLIDMFGEKRVTAARPETASRIPSFVRIVR